jgi:gluconolactonase
VATRGPDLIYKFPVKDDGSLGPQAIFVTIDNGNTGDADGMAIDVAGNVYGCTDGKGIQVWSPEGKPYGMVPGTMGAKNATFGGPDGKTLFFVAGNSLKKVDMKIAGLP